ncbi:hypothetical protein HK098_000942 [Nowakowskiella sp. JEL0407]|nr:hypothetical protein HK098_000942 [Nowakowskiella sp. JEL0407]
MSNQLIKRVFSSKPATPSVVAVADSTNKIFQADLVSGVPPSVSRRSVRIYKPARTATQQGNFKDFWKIDFDVQQRWENNLMGWSSSADTMQGTHIKFNSKDAAVLFAERQGYEYWVDEPKESAFRKKLYAENFVVRYS